MKVGDLVKLYGSPWLGIGVVTALYSKETDSVIFPNANRGQYPYGDSVEIWRERLEVLCE